MEKWLIINQVSNKSGFADGWSGYYPDHRILALEGGHTTDVCFSIKTGETEQTIGNPRYMISSPKNTYRLNGNFGDQECITYFFQKKVNNEFSFLTEFTTGLDVCTFKEFHWLDETNFVFILMDYMSDAENGQQVYYKGEIKTE